MQASFAVLGKSPVLRYLPRFARAALAVPTDAPAPKFLPPGR